MMSTKPVAVSTTNRETERAANAMMPPSSAQREIQIPS